MCGITGIININQPVEAAELDRFTDALSHRGPDGRGTFIDGRLGLGHRRLAILDLSDAGKCPMRYVAPDGREYWITYNGEIYNFIELRSELERFGYRFQSQTDTEVIVGAYHRWGEECLLRFNGMWAFAIYDVLERKLFIARDRFGIKPLYYWVGNGRFAFASELKAFLALDGFTPRFNQQAAALFLQNNIGYDGMTEETALQGIRRLHGGYCMTVDIDGDVAVRKWWETAQHIPPIPARYEEQVEQFRELFLDAVRLRMRADVPIGTSLSGGVDSSAVACSMKWVHENQKHGLERCPGDWQQTFVATFPGTAVDERRYADEVICHIGAKPHYWIFDSQAATSHIIATAWAMDDFTGVPAVPVWSIYREMRRHKVIVTLDGHGGDELLAGYVQYLDVPIKMLNQKLYQDFHATQLPGILRNYDRCSMAHGIEVRMPIMDWRLVTYAFGLPPETKIGAGYTKRILRDAMQGIMPDNIRARRSKIGFASPLVEWFNGRMAPLIRRIVTHRLWLQSPFWKGRELSEYVLAKTNAAAWTMDDWDACTRLWVFMNLVLWQQLFIEGDLDCLP